MILNDKITSTFPSYKNIVIVYYNLIDEDQNDQLSAENQRQQELIIKQQQEFLTIYRQSLARLQKEDPLAASAMPGFNALEMEEREKDIVEDMCRVVYSKRYYDLTHQYRHVILPKSIAKYVPTGKLMKESEWRCLGVVQTTGWVHYMIHEPEPHILLFKRPLDS